MFMSWFGWGTRREGKEGASDALSVPKEQANGGESSKASNKDETGVVSGGETGRLKAVSRRKGPQRKGAGERRESRSLDAHSSFHF